MPEISVVIATYNRREVLQRCLQALDCQTFPPDRFEVVVVDDGSTDDTAAMVRGLDVSYPLRYLRQPRRGPAAARNAGIRAALGWLIIFLDSDLIPGPQLVAAHYAAHWPDDRLIGHGPVIHTSQLDHPFDEPMKLTDISRAFFATGNVSIRKEHLLAAGLFDEEFVEYGWEDLELGQRLRKLGLKAVKVPAARGYHYKPRLELSQLPGLLERERQRARSAVLYHRKHPTARVRASIMYHPFFFALDRLLTAGNWPEWDATRRLLQRLEEAGRHHLLRFLVRIITQHAYLTELKRAWAADRKALTPEPGP